MDDGKHPSNCKWFTLKIFANFMLTLIVLLSIIKKGEIVTNMAPFYAISSDFDDRMITQSMKLIVLLSGHF